MKQCLRFRIRKLVCEFAMSVSWRLKESQLTICWQESWYIKIQLEKRHMKQRRRMGISARQPMVLGAVAASSKPHKCQCVRRLEHLDPKGLGHYSSQIGSVWKWSVPQRLPFWHILTGEIRWVVNCCACLKLPKTATWIHREHGSSNRAPMFVWSMTALWLLPDALFQSVLFVRWKLDECVYDLVFYKNHVLNIGVIAWAHATMSFVFASSLVKKCRE